MVLPYFEWNIDINATKRRIKQTHRHYTDVSDEGHARFSKRAAEDFLSLLIETFVSQDFSVPPLSDAYQKWKAKQGGFSEIGFFTGEMVESLETFRTRAGGDPNRTGWAVGIASRSADAAFLAQKLAWLEKGTGRKGGKWKAGPQPPRPIVAQALQKYLQADLPEVINQVADLGRIWKRK